MPSQPLASGLLPTIANAAADSSGAPAARRVRGLRKAWVLARLFTRVATIAFHTRRNPLHAMRALWRLHGVMQRQQWTTPTRRQRRIWTAQKFVFVSGRYFWDLFAPGWPSIAFDRCIERELERVDPLGRPPAFNTVIVAITRRCPLKCEHCFEWDTLNHPEVLSLADLREIVRRVQQRGTAQFIFSGGEPLRRFDDLLALCRLAADESDVWVQTAGVGLGAEKARRLREAGATGISLSLDHCDAAEHDRFRGLPGSFTTVGRAARHAREAGLLVSLSLCPTRSFTTRQNLDRYAGLAQSLGASFIQILEPKAIGHYAGQDVALGAAQRQCLEEFCERLNGDPAFHDHPSVEYMDWGARTLGCCGAGDRYAYVDTTGSLHACPFCPAPGLNVLEQDIHAAISILQDAGCPASRRTSSCAS
jgi:MoaA/NifB/PqqE/SkfB family radical SAM enzyme